MVYLRTGQNKRRLLSLSLKSVCVHEFARLPLVLSITLNAKVSPVKANGQIASSGAIELSSQAAYRFQSWGT